MLSHRLAARLSQTGHATVANLLDGAVRDPEGVRSIESCSRPLKLALQE